MWVWRSLSTTSVIAANLDVSAFAQERAALNVRLIIIGVLMSIMTAIGGYLLIRRMQRPLKTLSEHLSHAVAFGPQQIETAHIPKDDIETATLMHAYNRMTLAVQDREQISEQLAKQDQQALLGRIAATLAHEIRNRNEALDFIDRGIQSLQGVAEATLNAYRPSAPGPHLNSRDLHDVLLLVKPQAARKQVVLADHVALHSAIPLDAFKIRQIALNLLLNAIQTSTEGSTVTLETVCTDDRFVLRVSDEGAGLPPHVKHFLRADNATRSDRSLGLEIVRRLTNELHGEITILDRKTRGSTIELAFNTLQDKTP